ncbi:hypothetical protein U9M48_012196 [Paspalum notatum var. saurae]|uniref:Pentatricopeptide repeat-containing protein n=1 Tax=Paspalum notatum var. saurae TaxID=547442 RepID=A0AAQ3SX30_PASNO
MSPAPPPPPPPPPPNPTAAPRVVRAPPPRPPARPPGPPPWAERRPAVSVDLDRGRRSARAEVDGVRAASLPARHRLRVEGSRWERDWKVSEAAARVLALPRPDAHAVDAVLGCWAGRFARRNFPLLIREITISGSLKHAVHVFRWMKNQENYRARNDIYGMMIRLHARHNQVDQARGLFFEMQEWRCKPDADTYNSLIHAHARAGQWRWAINIMEDMQRIGSYLSLGDYEKALELYTLMRVRNVMPDAVTYNILISGYCKLGKYAESLKFFEDMMDLNIRMTKEVYSSGKLTEAEYNFSSMKESGCFPDVVTYTAMIKAYSDDGSWRRAWDLFEEMESNYVQPDAIVCSSLMEALNKGSQPERVLQLLESMKQKQIPLNQKAYFEIIASCSMLRDWKTASEIIEHLDSSLPSISVGTLNHLLNFLGKCGKTDSMMKLFYKMVTSCSTVGLSTYTVLLKNLLVVGKWRKYVEVLQWMEDAGVRPTLYMYQSVLPYIWRDNSMDYVTLMQEKISALREKVT